MDSLAGKSVKILTRGAGPSMNVETKDVKVYPPDISESFRIGMTNVGWSGYLTASLERKLSSLGGKSVKEEPELQLMINENIVGLRSRIFYVPFIPFFVFDIYFDIYQHRTYWALFDATVDIKSKDGEQILKSRKIRAQSHTMEKPRIFAPSILF